MFFVSVSRAGREIESRSFESMSKLASHARSEFKRERADDYIVSVGATDQAVMPYAWVSRNHMDHHHPGESGGWVGHAGDAIRLGLDQNEIAESDPIDEAFMGLDEAVRRGVASIYEDGEVTTVVMHDDPSPKVDHADDEEKAVRMAKSILKRAGL